MKRTTIFVPEALERELQGLARREGKPVASVVREALATYVASQRRGARLPSFAAVGEGAEHDVAERHEELLWNSPHEVPARSGATARKASAHPRRKTTRSRTPRR